ncbi:hypothetical protein HYU07_05260 [Candidatus Woesearchaeota archaeon]|nr:hypothetical protein [Candidatus Woesearchaeota archaeon]
MKQIYFIFVIIALMGIIIISGCAITPEQKPAQEEVFVNTTLDYKFELKINETAFITSNKTNDIIEIKFLDVTEDSRCPSDNYVACAWEGQATIIVNILKNDQNLGNFSLTSRAAHEELAVKAFDGYSIKLLEVNPSQKVAQKIELSDYTVMLVVSKV